MKNEKGFVIINGGKAEPLPVDLFDVLSKLNQNKDDETN